MKNYIKKIVAFLLVLFVGISLVACDDDKEVEYNSTVPYGSITTDVYASLGESKLTNKQLYDDMRATGYTTFTNMLLEKLIPAQELKDLSEEKIDELKELINKQCFGTTELDKLNEATKKDAIKKYTDNFALLNVKVTSNAEGTELTYNDEVLEYYLPQLAQQDYAKSLILTNKESKYYYENEFQIENGTTLTEEHDGHTHDLENPYYITEDDYQAQYEKNRAEDDEYEVVIVAFNTLNDAIAAVGGKNVTITPEVIKAAYAKQYAYKGEADYTYTSKELSVYNSSLVSLIQNMEDGEYTKTPVQFGKNVYLVHLIAGTPEVGDYNKADEAALREDIVEGFVTSSFISTVVGEYVKSCTLTIYDPVYDALYAAENEDHTRLTASAGIGDGKTLAKIVTPDNKEITISVDEFYTELEQLLGVTTTLDYFLNEVLLSKGYTLTDKEKEEIEKEIKEILETFNDNGYASYGYPSTIGEDTFKFVYFGTADDDRIYSQYEAQKMWDYIVDEKPENYYEILEAVGKQYYESYFNLSVKHVLVFVDYDMDGTPDDPELYFQNFDDATVSAIKTDIAKLMDAIVKEANYIYAQGYMTLTDALTYVGTEYYANGKVLHTSEDDTWESFKTYNLGVTIEDLGAVNTSNASNYVTEFGVGVHELYKELSNKEGYELGDPYLAQSVSSVEDLIKTSYGYHILSVYDASELTTAKYSAEDDTAGQYADDKITVTYTDENDEKQTLTFKNAYSANEWATAEQIKIYASAMEHTGSVTTKYLPTDVKTYISYFYSSFVKRYEDSNMQKIFITENNLCGEGQLVFTNAANNAKLDEFIEIQKVQYDSYKDLDDTMFAGWWELFQPTTAE